MEIQDIRFFDEKTGKVVCHIQHPKDVTIDNHIYNREAKDEAGNIIECEEIRPKELKNE